MIRVWQRPAPLLDVLEEHLEEAAFLHGACRQCTADPELSWEDLPDRESRLDAHLDGLVIGGSASAEILADKPALDEDGDPGEVFVAAAVIPALDRVEPMEWLREGIAADTPHLGALQDGLRFSGSPCLLPWLYDYLDDESPPVRETGALILGWRNVEDAVQPLSERIDDPEPRVSLAAQMSLARIGSPPAPARLTALCTSPDARIAERALTELLARGEPAGLDILRRTCRDGTLEHRRLLLPLLGAAGGPMDMEAILAALQSDPELAEAGLLALGLCGHPGAAERLIDALGDAADESVFAAAHAGLRALTGLDALPEFDLDEAEESDVADHQDLWRSWWRERGSPLSPDLAWRRGAPLSPGTLVADLMRPGNTRRDLSHLELCLRYACTLPLDPHGRFATQQIQLARLADWAKRADEDFEPGQLYVGGEPIAAR